MSREKRELRLSHRENRVEEEREMLRESGRESEAVENDDDSDWLLMNKGCSPSLCVRPEYAPTRSRYGGQVSELRTAARIVSVVTL